MSDILFSFFKFLFVMSFASLIAFWVYDLGGNANPETIAEFWINNLECPYAEYRVLFKIKYFKFFLTKKGFWGVHLRK